MRKAFFLDRDGVILEMVYHPEVGKITTALTPEQASFMPGIFDLLQETKIQGFLNIIISNQPNIGLGQMSLKNHELIKEKIEGEFNKNGVGIDDQYYCFHHPFAKFKKYKKRCNCRKPEIGMLTQAAKKYDIDFKKSWLIGDGVYDVIAGHKAGCRTILIANFREAEYLRIMEKELKGVKPDFIVKRHLDVIPILRSSSK